MELLDAVLVDEEEDLPQPVFGGAHICEISKQPDKFSSARGIVMADRTQEAAARQGFAAMPVIIEMDPPEHRSYRAVTSPVFTPRAVKALDAVIEKSDRELVDELATATDGHREGECDFANDVAVKHPLRVLSTMLGVPRESEPLILRLTNEAFAVDDPDLQRKAEDREKATLALDIEFYQVFDTIIRDRRANPTDDIASVLANATIDGKPIKHYA